MLAKPRPAPAVIVTVLNEVRTVSALVAALAAQTRLPSQVVIVDGGSNDGTVAELKRLQIAYPTLLLKVITEPGNRSHCRNKGIQHTTTEWLAITDAGCTPEPTWLEELYQAAQRVVTAQPDSWPVVAGYYRGVWQTPFEQAVIPYALVMPDRVNPAHFLPATRSMLIHRSAWQMVGGFPEELSGNEDYWLARQLDRLSREPASRIRLTFTDRAVVVWQPRSTLRSFVVMIYRFAAGDAEAQLYRPKVAAIFARYVLGVVLVAGLGWYRSVGTASLVLGFGLLAYASWSIIKNRKYVSDGWYWLPVLQVSSDWAVLWGTIVGRWRGRRLHLAVPQPKQDSEPQGV